MSQSGRSHRPEAGKKPAEVAEDPKYLPGESSTLADPMRSVRSQREQASAQIAHTMKVWRKADGGPAPEEDAKNKGEEEQADGEKADAADGEKKDGEKADGEKKDDEKADGEKKDGEKADGEKKDGEKADGEKKDGDEAKEEKPAEEKVQRKVFLARDGTPGNNQAQNKQFDDAVREIEKKLGKQLSKDQRRQLHDAITGQNLGFQEIVQEGMGMFGK